MEISELAKILVALGCPAGKSAEMAAQLDKRVGIISIKIVPLDAVK